MEFRDDGAEDEQNYNERKLIRRPPPSDGDSWNALPEVPKRAEMGYLHLSFEYHKGALKARVWQISDLLLPPPQTSMIQSVFVRGYFIPDAVGKTRRRTEEVVVDVRERGGPESAKTGIQHIFTASSFKFRTALLYTGVTGDMVRARSLRLEVCMVQKGSGCVFLMAMVHMPLRTAVRRPIRQKYPLIPCMNVTIPNNMRVYSATDLQLQSSSPGEGGSSGPTNRGWREGEGEGWGSAPTPGGQVDLEDVVSLTGDEFLRAHLSLCLDDSDDQLDGRSPGVRRRVAGSGGSSCTTLDIPSSADEDDDDDDDDDDAPSSVVTTDNEGLSAGSTPVNMSSGDVSPSTSSSNKKKRIIPNEVPSSLYQDVSVEMPSEETVLEMENPQSSDNPQRSLPSASSPAPLTADSKVMRKKIIPAEATLPNPSSDSGRDTPVVIEINGLSGDVTKSESSTAKSELTLHQSPVMSRKKKKIIPGEITIQTDSVPQSAASKTHPDFTASEGSSSRTDPERLSAHTRSDGLSPHTRSDGLSPRSHSDGLSPRSHSDGLSPHGDSGLDSSPFPDSAFSPTSRPETPCWDFYDFSDEVGGEEEGGDGELLEAGLSQLRAQDVGSWQNTSNTPILPMGLPEDFDTLAVLGDCAE